MESRSVRRSGAIKDLLQGRQIGDEKGAAMLGVSLDDLIMDCIMG